MAVQRAKRLLPIAGGRFLSSPVSRDVLADTIVTAAARDARPGGVVPVVAAAQMRSNDDRISLEQKQDDDH
jgi:hypothetical protein